jgi:hypothetical protein
MNKGQFFAIDDEGELHEIGELKEMETFLPDTMNEQLEKLEKINEAWKHVGEQITFVIENCRSLIDILNDIVPKYIRTELKFPKKKKRGTMRRRRRERRVDEKYKML